MLALMQCVSFVIGPSWWDKMHAGPISGGVSYYDAQRYSAISHSVNKLICFYPVREILIKFLIINSWVKYEEMLRNPTNASSHKKTHITMILYVEIRSSWGKYQELAQYLTRNISREKYFLRGIFLARF